MYARYKIHASDGLITKKMRQTESVVLGNNQKKNNMGTVDWYSFAEFVMYFQLPNDCVNENTCITAY